MFLPQVTPGQYQVLPVAEGLFRADLNVQVQLWPAHYERGAPILRCEAKVGELYKEDNTVALYSANSDPKIERGEFIFYICMSLVRLFGSLAVLRYLKFNKVNTLKLDLLSVC